MLGVAGKLLTYEDLSYAQKKYVQFCVAEHTNEIPLLPIFPMRLASLLRYAWWLQDHGVKGGMASIRNYIGAATVWSETMGHGNPKEAEPWVWKRFAQQAPKYIRVFNGSQAKLPVQPEFLRLMTVHTSFDLSSVDDMRELLAYSILIFTGIRVGHLLPKNSSKQARQHLLDWNNVKFEPNFDEATVVVFLLDSTKVRSVAKKDPWWTAVGTCEAVPMLCPVMLMKIWYQMSHTGRPEDNSQYLLSVTPSGAPMSRAAFTRRFRARMEQIAPVLGFEPGAFDVNNYSGISFRKGAFSALAPHVQPHTLMQSADHKNLRTTVQHYLSDTIQQRAGNTALISRGFAETRPSWAQDVKTESVWAHQESGSENDIWIQTTIDRV